MWASSRKRCGEHGTCAALAEPGAVDGCQLLSRPTNNTQMPTQARSYMRPKAMPRMREIFGLLPKS